LLRCHRRQNTATSAAVEPTAVKLQCQRRQPTISGAVGELRRRFLADAPLHRPPSFPLAPCTGQSAGRRSRGNSICANAAILRSRGEFHRIEWMAHFRDHRPAELAMPRWWSPTIRVDPWRRERASRRGNALCNPLS
jgi:hypothetical protein